MSGPVKSNRTAVGANPSTGYVVDDGTRHEEEASEQEETQGYAAPEPRYIAPINAKQITNQGWRNDHADLVRQQERDDVSFARQQVRQKREEAAAKKRAFNNEREKDFRSRGVENYTDADGLIQPVLDEKTGKPVFKERTGEIQYDPVTGRAIQTKRDRAGRTTVVDLDKDAPIEFDKDDPFGKLRRKNKHSPEEEIDPEEGIKSTDPRVHFASAKALYHREQAEMKRRGAEIGSQIEQADLDGANGVFNESRRVKDGLTGRQVWERTIQENSTPIPRPVPKASFFGLGTTQDDPREIEEWQTNEALRNQALAEAEGKIKAADDYGALKQQRKDIEDKRRKFEEDGPGGFLQRRKAEEERARREMTPEGAKELSERLAVQRGEMETESQKIETEAQELQARAEKGLTGAEIDDHVVRVHGVQSRIDALNEKQQQYNEEVQGVQKAQEGAAAERIRDIAIAKKGRKEWLTGLKANPKTAAFAEKIEGLDAEADARMKDIEKLYPLGGSKRMIAEKALQKDIERKSKEIEGEHRKEVRAIAMAEKEKREQLRQNADKLIEAQDAVLKASAYGGIGMLGFDDPAEKLAKEASPEVRAEADRLREERRITGEAWRSNQGYVKLPSGELAINPRAMSPEWMRGGMGDWRRQLDHAQEAGDITPEKREELERKYEGIEEQSIEQAQTLILDNDRFRDWLKTNRPELERDGAVIDSPEVREAATRFLNTEPEGWEKFYDKMGRFVEGAYQQTGADLAKSVGVLTNTLTFGTTGAIEDNIFYKLGKGVDENIRMQQDPRMNESGWSRLATGLGSAAGFMAGGGAVGIAAKAGIALKLAKAARIVNTADRAAEMARIVGGTEKVLSRTGTIGVMTQGSLQQGAQLYEEARDAGLDHNHALLPFALGGLIGASEAIPIGKFINRLAMPKRAVAWKTITNMLVEGLEEFSQEGFQQFSSNAVAKMIYDKNRDLFEGVMGGAVSGGEVGMIVSLLSSALGNMRVRAARRRGRPVAANEDEEDRTVTPDYLGVLGVGRRVQLEGKEKDGAKLSKEEEIEKAFLTADPSIEQIGQFYGYKIGEKKSGISDGGEESKEANAPEKFELTPEGVAVAHDEIDNAELPPDMTPEDARIEREAAKAAFKIVLGTPYEELSKNEQAVLGKAIGEEKSPRIDTVGGKTVLTAAQIEALHQYFPEAGRMVEKVMESEAESSEDSGGEIDSGATQEELSKPPQLPKTNRERWEDRHETNRAGAIKKMLVASGVYEDVASSFARQWDEQNNPDISVNEARDKAQEDFRKAAGQYHGEKAGHSEDVESYIAAGYSPEEAAAHAENAKQSNAAARAEVDKANAVLGEKILNETDHDRQNMQGFWYGEGKSGKNASIPIEEANNAQEAAVKLQSALGDEPLVKRTVGPRYVVSAPKVETAKPAKNVAEKATQPKVPHGTRLRGYAEMVMAGMSPKKRAGMKRTVGFLAPLLDVYGGFFDRVRFVSRDDGASLLYNVGNRSLDIDLAGAADEISSARKAASLLRAMLREELLHRAATDKITREQAEKLWELAPDGLKSKVRDSYWRARVQRGEAVPEDAPFNMGHELLRMVMQDEFFGEITESVEIDKRFIDHLIELLETLGEQLKAMIADTSVTSVEAREALQEAKDLVAERLNELGVKKEVSESTAGQSIKDDGLLRGKGKSWKGVRRGHAKDRPGSLVGGGEGGHSVAQGSSVSSEADAGGGSTAVPVEGDSGGDFVDGGELSIKESVFAQLGKRGKAYTDNNEEIEFVWAIVEGDNLVASNEDSGRVNPEYPQELQPRDRSSAASQDQVNDIAKNSNFDRLSHSESTGNGAPIVGPADGVVESGNGRVMGLRRAYARGLSSVASYKARLAQEAASLGLDGSKVAGMKAPVLVRVRQAAVNRQRFVEVSNVSSVAPMREIEMARVDARNIRASIFNNLDQGGSGNIFTAENHGFIQAFVDTVVPKGERPSVMDANGVLSQSGLRRIRNALFVYAYGGSNESLNALGRLAEDIDAEGKNITNAMVSIAPAFSRINAAIKGGSLYDIGIAEDISAAVQAYTAIRERGDSVEAYLNQGQLIDDGVTPLQKDILGFIEENKRSGKKIFEAFQRYAQAVELAGDPRQEAFFKEEAPSKEGLWNVARKSPVQEEKKADDGQGESVLKAGNVAKTINAKNALKIYSRLFNLEKAGGKLTPGQRAVMEAAERVLGQTFMFEGEGYMEQSGQTLMFGGQGYGEPNKVDAEKGQDELFASKQPIAPNRDDNPYRSKSGSIVVPFRASSNFDSALQDYENKMRSVVEDVSKADAAYNAISDSKGGKVIGTDIARDLLPEYAEGREGHLLFVNATGRVGQAYAKDRLWREIRNRGNRKTLFFTAGGVAAGKSTAVTDEMLQDAHLVFDGTLRETDWAEQTIREALKNGWDVGVFYVQRPLTLVAKGAINRADKTGRWGAYASLPDTHLGAQQSIVSLSKAFAGTTGVTFNYFLNDGLTIDHPPTVLSLKDIDEGGRYSYSKGEDERISNRPDSTGRRSSGDAEKDASRKGESGGPFSWHIRGYSAGEHVRIFREAVQSKEYEPRVLRLLAEGNPILERIAGRVTADDKRVSELRAGKTIKLEDEAAAMEDAVKDFDRELSKPQQERLRRVAAKQFAEVEAANAEVLRAHDEEGKPLPAPNGKPSKLNRRQWVQVRTPLFKQWFGDWEGVNLIKRINETTLYSVTSEEGAATGDPKTLRKEAVASYKGRNQVTNRATGNDIRIEPSGINNSLKHGAALQKRAVVQVLDNLLEGAAFVVRDTENMKQGVTAVETYAGRVMVDKGPLLIVRLVVREVADGRRFYDHELSSFDLEKGARPEGYSGGSAGAFTNRRSELQTHSSLGKVILDKAISVNPETVSKVVDENGEPMEVYHGAGDEFNEFKESTIGTSRGGLLFYSAGFYFSTEEIDAKAYSRQGRVVPAFLNLRKVLDLTSSNHAEFLKVFGDLVPKGENEKLSDLVNKARSPEDIRDVRVIPYAQDGFYRVQWYDGKEWNTTGARLGTVKFELDGDLTGWKYVINQLKAESKRFYRMNIYNPFDTAKALKKHGYDGVKGDGSIGMKGYEFVAFTSNQIKSATGNEGMFSGSENVLRASPHFQLELFADQLTRVEQTSINQENQEKAHEQGTKQRAKRNSANRKKRADATGAQGRAAEVGMGELFGRVVGLQDARDRARGDEEPRETEDLFGWANDAPIADDGQRSGRVGSDGNTVPDAGDSGRGRGRGGVGDDRPGRVRGTEGEVDGGDRAGRGQRGKRRVAAKIERPPVGDPARNYKIGPDEELSPRGVMSKLKANLEALRIIKEIGEQKRNATAEEKAALVKFSGWGALSQIFDDEKADSIAREDLDQWRKTLERYRQLATGSSAAYYASILKSTEENIARLANWQEKWGAHHDTVKSLLDDREYRAAKISTVNAHYTSPNIISAMWNIVRRMGFKGGSILEPGAGIGHFFGLMPDAIADRSKLFGVELDGTTSKILKALYPEADIQNTGFQTADIADGSIDLAISNVPFLNAPVSDAALQAAGGPVGNLHDYFFGKTLTKLKPGGMMVFITSAFTMDKGNAEARKWLAGRADLVAAYRLPNDAFKENAGTEVVTDIIILRKKDGKPFAHGQDWARLGAATVARNGEEIRINEYFVKNPGNILGILDNDGKMFAGREGKKEMTVHGDANRPADLALVMAGETLPEGIFQGSERGANVRAKIGKEPVRMGSVYEKDGKIYIQGQKELDATLNDKKNLPRAQGFIRVRDALNRQYELELSSTATDEEVEANRRLLNAAYTNFVLRFKDFHNNANRNLFVGDPDYVRVAGAEVEEDMAASIGDYQESVEERMNRRRNAKTKYVKADIFTKRVLRPAVEPTTADSLEDAFGISMGWRGRVDLEFIASLLSEDDSQRVGEQLVSHGIAVRDPASGDVVTREQYLAGNVRKKLIAAKAAGPQYAKNVETLEAIQPERVSIQDAGFDLGATWIPAGVYERFLASLGITGVKITYDFIEGSGVSDRWAIDKKKAKYYNQKHKDYQTNDMSIFDALDSVMNMRRISISNSEKDGGGENFAKTAIAKETAKRLNAAFIEWARNEAGVSQELEEAYNNEVNAFVPRAHDGQFLSLPWLSKDFEIYPDKKNTIWRAISEGFGLIAHGVGGGKTIIGGAIALEQRRLGLARKPLLLVHNSTLEGYAKEIAKMAPNARVLVGRKKDLQGANRKEFLMRIASGDWDAVIMAHSTFDRIADDPQIEIDHMNALIDELMEALSANGFDSLWDAEHASSQKKTRTVKNIVKTIQKLQTSIEKILDGKKSDYDILNFQQLGIDSIVVDEAHIYKKMPFATKLDAKGIDGSFSQRGYKLLLRARAIQERMGGKNVFAMTGTPVTNTLGEIWNMARLVAPHILKEYKIETFDQFVSKFATVETTTEQSASGEYKKVDRLASMRNLPEWSVFLRMVADVKLGEDLIVKGRPKIRGGGSEVETVPRTEGVAKWTDYIIDVLDAFSKFGPKDFEGNPSLQAVPVQAYMASRAAAIDIRMIEPRAKDEPGSKVNAMIENLMRVYHETSGYRGTQVVFADSYRNQKISLFDGVVPNSNLDIELDPSKPAGTTFNLYEDIREKLVARGVPRHEIAVITDKKYDNEKAREELFEAVNRGDVRIIMGSTEKLGTGVNMQGLMAEAHSLDVPWTPAGLEQREGRVYRQGNMHAEMKAPVGLSRYGMLDTLDAALWQILDTKGRFIRQAMTNKFAGREITEDDPIGRVAVQLAILRGGRALEIFNLEERIKELSALRAGRESEAARKERDIASAKDYLRIMDARSARVEPSLQAMDALAKTIEKDGATISVNSQTFDTKTEMLEAVNAEINASKEKFKESSSTPMGELAIRSVSVNGVPVYIHAEAKADDIIGREEGLFKKSLVFSLASSKEDAKESFDFGRVSSAQTLVARLEELSDTVASIRSSMKRDAQRFREIADQSVERNDDGAEYERLVNELAALQAEDRAERTKRAKEQQSGDVLKASQNLIRGIDDLLNPSYYRKAGTTKAGSNGAETVASKNAPTEALVKDNLGLATSIAQKYRNVVGADMSDIIQEARMALVKSAQGFDASRGVPFGAYAARAIQNQLNSLYGKALRIAKNETVSLDEPVGDDEDSTRGDFIASPEVDRLPIEREETAAEVEAVVSKLPERPQAIVRGYMAGKTGEEIARELGISRQAVNASFQGAKAVLRQQLKMRGFTGEEDGILYAGKQNIRDDDSRNNDYTELLAELYEDLPSQDEIDALRKMAHSEPKGKRTVGQPDKANYAKDDTTRVDINVVQHMREQEREKQEENEWIAEARKRVVRDWEGAKKTVLQKALSPEKYGTFTAVEVKMAQLMVPELMRLAYKSGNKERQLEAFALAWAYDVGGSEQARAFAARRDPYKTPVERHLEMLTKMISTPPPNKRRWINGAKTEKEKRQRVKEAQLERLEKIEKALAEMGVTLEDIFAGEATVMLKSTALVQMALSEFDQKVDRDIIRLTLDGFSDKDIAKQVGLPVSYIVEVQDRFDEILSEKLGSYAERGFTAKDMESVDTSLFAGLQNMRRATLSPEEKRQKVAEMLAKIRPNRKDRNSGKLVKRKKKAKKQEVVTGPRPSNKPLKYVKMIREQDMFDNKQPWEFVRFDAGNQDQAVRAARIIQATDSNGFDMVYEVWINGILSGPQTHAVNITSNALMALWDFGVQRPMEAAMNLGVRDKDSASFGELLHLWRGAIPGIVKGWYSGIRAWHTEQDFFEFDALNKQIEFESFDKGGNIRASVPGQTGRTIRMSGRALMFMDSFFKYATGQMEVGAQAYRIGKAQGLEGKKLETFIKDQIDTPNSMAWQRAVTKARELTFQTELPKTGVGSIVRKIGDLRQRRSSSIGGRILELGFGMVFPFIRTPYNLFRVGLRKSPLGALNVAKHIADGFYSMRNGKPFVEGYSKAQMVSDLTEQAIAFAVLALLWGLTEGDDDDDNKFILITGSRPYGVERQGERDALNRMYGGTYQIRIGGRNGVYLNYGRLDPFAVVIGTVVDMIRTIKSDDPKDVLPKMMSYLVAQAQDKTFLQGFSTIADTLNDMGRDPGKVTQSWAKLLLSGLVPNLIRQPLRNLDDYVRDSRYAGMGYMFTAAPSLAERRSNLYGEDMKKQGHGLTRLFTVAGLQPTQTLKEGDRFLTTWNRNNPEQTYWPERPNAAYYRIKDRRGNTVAMTPAQIATLDKLAGQAFDRGLRSWLTSSRAKRPTSEDMDRFKSELQKARSDAKETISRRAALVSP